MPPSTARNDFVMATEILVASYGTTAPLRLMTRNCPGAVLVSEAITVLVTGPAAVALPRRDALASAVSVSAVIDLSRVSTCIGVIPSRNSLGVNVLFVFGDH